MEDLYRVWVRKFMTLSLSSFQIDAFLSEVLDALTRVFGAVFRVISL